MSYWISLELKVSFFLLGATLVGALPHASRIQLSMVWDHFIFSSNGVFLVVVTLLVGHWQTCFMGQECVFVGKELIFTGKREAIIGKEKSL